LIVKKIYSKIKVSGIYSLLRWNLKTKVRMRELRFSKKYFDSNKLTHMDWKSTLNLIHDNRLSLARFGDGEFFCMSGHILGEKYGANFCSKELRERLRLVFQSNNNKLLIGVYPPPPNKSGRYMIKAKLYYNEYIYFRTIRGLRGLIRPDYIYADALAFLNLSKFEEEIYRKEYFDLVNSLWRNRDVVFVTSKNGMLDMNHDIFEGVKIAGIIDTPNYNAYTEYSEILNRCSIYSNDTLFLVSLGFTACLLVHDLCHEGYQALDIGHITTG
jgi:hypothetical protein